MVRLTVYAGSRPGIGAGFVETAEALGTWMAGHRIGLVYGGGWTGLMGAVADAVLAGGGDAVGVIPKFMAEKGQAHKGVSPMIRVETMRERKEKLLSLGNGCIALPGGPGTAEEITEAISLMLLGRYQGPCLLYDVEGCWQYLAAQYQKMAVNGFFSVGALSRIHVVRSIEEVEAALHTSGLC